MGSCTELFTAFFALCFISQAATTNAPLTSQPSSHLPGISSTPDFLLKEELFLTVASNPHSKVDDVTSEGSGGWVVEVQTTAFPSTVKLRGPVNSTKNLGSLLELRNATTIRNKSKGSPRKKQGLKKSPRRPSQSEIATTPVRENAVSQTATTEFITDPSTPYGLEMVTPPILDPQTPWTRGPLLLQNKDIPHLGKKRTSDPRPPDPLFKLYPAWSEAKLKWGVAWEAHLYTAAPFFVLLALYSFASLLRARFVAHLLGRSHFVFLNAFHLVLGASRTVYLLDGYNCQKRFPTPIAYFLQDIGSPCLSSSFAILFLALLKTAHVQINFSSSQGTGFVSAAVAFHFSLTMTSDIIASLVDNAEPLILACQTAYGLWCLILSAAYFVLFRNLHKAAIRKQCEMIRLTFTKLHIDGATLPRKLPRPTLALTVRVTLLTAVLVLFLAVLQIYGVVFVYGLSTTRKPDPWTWWGYQYANRWIELVICGCLALAANQTIRQYEGESGICSRFIPCKCVTPACFCQEDTDLYDTFLDSNSGGYRHPLGKNGTRKGNSLPLFHPVPSSDPEENIHGLTLQPGDYEDGRAIGNGAPIEFDYHYRHSNHRTLSDGKSPMASAQPLAKDGRPSSMLFMDQGFIRFRSENDPEQLMELSDANSETETHGSPSKWSSILAEAGSSGMRSLCEDDFVQSSLSPFFKRGYRHQQLLPRFRRYSRCSLDTLDNTSGDISTDVVQGHVRPFSDSQMLPKKCGSTCSSESAANSFDVTFFLQQRKLEPALQVKTMRKDNPYYQVPFQKGISSSALRSVSPLVAASSKRFQVIPLNLDLNKEGLLSCGFSSVACGTEDITPDSAVYMDLPLSRDSEIEPNQNLLNGSNQDPLSHSLSDLSGWKAGSLRCKKSLTFLNKLKGSSFSLNHGYEPLNKAENDMSKVVTYKMRSRDARSVRPRTFISLSDIGPEDRVDSGLLGDCRDQQYVLVDTASQTDTTPQLPALISSRPKSKLISKVTALQNS